MEARQKEDVNIIDKKLKLTILVWKKYLGRIKKGIV